MLTIDALSHDRDLRRRTIERLHELEDLLALEHVGDPDRAEAGYFAAIDILDPVVEEICLLTDGLRSVVAALPEHERYLSAEFHPSGSGYVSRSQCPFANALAFPADGMGDAQ